MNKSSARKEAEKLHIRFDGFQSDFPDKDKKFFMFTDLETGSTFVVSKLRETCKRLNELRETWRQYAALRK